MLEDHDRQRRIVAAVCAATTALAIHKIGLGRNVTSYPAPAFKEKLESAGYKHMDDEVVADKNILTSQGPGTSFHYALSILSRFLLVRRNVKRYAKPCWSSEYAVTAH